MLLFSCRRRFCFAAWLLGLCLMVSGCGTAPAPTRPKLRLLHSRWQDGAALAWAAAVVAKDRLGLDVEVLEIDFKQGLGQVSRGEADAFMTLWLPDTNRSQLEAFGADLADMGPAFSGAQAGLVAPLDLEVEEVGDLDRVADQIGGKILTIETGSGLNRNTVKAVETYDLDIEVEALETEALFARLEAAQAEGRPLVFTGWSPHWMFSRWRLKFLADPKGAFGAREHLHPVTPRDLAERRPRAAALLRGLDFNEAQFGSLLSALRGSEEPPEEVVRLWLASEPVLVNAWLKDVPPAGETGK